MFDTVAEAIQKIQGTVIMKGDEPVLIAEIGGRDKRVTATYRTLDNPTYTVASLSDKDFETASLGGRLGYINLTHRNIQNATYARRTPVRRSHQTQGLHNTNVYIDPLRPVAALALPAHQYNFSTLQYGFLKPTMQHKFPSLALVRRNFAKRTDDMVAQAFDPSLAILKGRNDLFHLMYKGLDIGHSEDLESFKVSKEWRYLDKLFDDHSMKVR